MLGIVNGTTNFILTRMTEEGSGYADASPRRSGLYAEADPTADVEGDDAGQVRDPRVDRVQRRVVASDVYREGIANVTPRTSSTRGGSATS